MLQIRLNRRTDKLIMKAYLVVIKYDVAANFNSKHYVVL